MLEENKNAEQNIQIAEIKKDVSWIKERIEKIENQVFNEIPHQISELKKELVNLKLSNKTWLVGILVSLIFLLFGVIANLFIK